MLHLDLGLCMQGPNLNLSVLRGYASLGRLAHISKADEFDQLSNEAGIQRSAAARHASEALDYALGAAALDNSTNPRAFPEVILNVRDVSVIRLDGQTPPPHMSLTVEHHQDGSVKISMVSLQVELSRLDVSPLATGQPQVSRVDGNHRLLQASKLMNSGEFGMDDFPVVPFALYVGLDADQERKLFTDINGNHKAMNRSFLLRNTSLAPLTPHDILIGNRFAEKLASDLSKDGRVFDNLVNFGGSLSSYRAKYGMPPPLTLVGVSNAMRELHTLGPKWVQSNLNDYPRMLEWVDMFFRQVRNAFPDQWVNKRDYVLLKSLGLNSISMLAGTIFANFQVRGEDYDREIIAAALAALKQEMDFDRFKWAGTTGKTGIKRMFLEMLVQLRAAGFEDYAVNRFGW